MTDFLHVLERVLIAAHVIAGFAGLVAAPIAMAVRKGGAWHNRAGWVFFYCMVVIFVSTIALAFFRFNFFLLVVAVGSMYAALTGVRALLRGRGDKNAIHGPNALDWGASVVTLLSGAGLALLSLAGLAGLGSQYQPIGFNSVIGALFGVAYTLAAIDEIRFFRTPATPLERIRRHGGQMGGAYSAMVTAFLVQNVARHLPENLAWMVWVAPGVLAAVLLPRLLKPYAQPRAQAR
jgi:hypothetical protein